MRLKPLACALALLAGPAFSATEDTQALIAELKRLSARVEALEKQNKAMEQSLASKQSDADEPEIVSRLKAIELKSAASQQQPGLPGALEGISVEASISSVVQKTSRSSTASGAPETRANYRGDIAVNLPGGSVGEAEGRIFAHMRFGQGNGIGLRPTYTSGPNSTAFQVGSVAADDSFAILAQAWYQLAVPIKRGAQTAQERLLFTVGKIDPFVFFDQNAAAGDESTQFLNNIFVHNPLLDSGGDIGADQYGFAPGVVLRYANERNGERNWGLSLGAFGSGPGANFSGSPSKGFVIAQADTGWRLGGHEGNYRGYVWTNGRGQGYDGVQRRHSGWGLSIDQKVAESLTLFGRYGHETKGKLRFDRALTAGLELGGEHWQRGDDALGFAFGALRTSRDFRNDAPGNPAFAYAAQGWEKDAELYYRFNVNKHVELSPHWQMIRNPGGDGSASSVRVVGLRAVVGF